MKKLEFIFLFLFFFINLYGQEKEEKIKKGFSVGGIPIIAFDQDKGYTYGGLVNLFDYGEGKNYPNYNQSLFLQWSKTTKGGGKSLLSYDALTLIPETRLTFTMAYLTEEALNFYGFNGYQSFYNNNFENKDHADYISRMYYRFAKKLFITSIDFQGKMKIKSIKWLAGFAYFNTKIGSVDIDKLNKNQSSDLLPDTPLLYDKYIEWKVIPSNQEKGGQVSFFKVGAVYDTRNNESNPEKGIWSEALLITAPGFMGNEYAFTKLLLTHRQFISLLPKRVSLAYRLSYQTKIAGEIPFYMLSYVIDSKATQDGLGGAKTLRGIKRNRVVGDGMAFANIELRSKWFKRVLLNQNFYLGFDVFADLGKVTNPYKFSSIFDTLSNLTTEQQNNYENLHYADESIHFSYGAGLRFVFNSNFVIVADYGIATNKNDGTNGLYIGVNYIF